MAAAARSGRAGRPGRPFIHLRVHSAYSLLEGALPLGKIVGFAVRDDAPAIAVTDTNNLFGALEFAQKAVKDGVQPLIGCQLDIAFDDEAAAAQGAGKRQAEAAPVVLFAATAEGYLRLMDLVSRAFMETPAGEAPHVMRSWLEADSDGLIALTGGEKGPIGRALAAGDAGLAVTRLGQLSAIFPDRLYVELSRHRGYDRAVERGALELALAHDLPVVATNEAFFATEADFEAHDALIAIAEGAVVAEDNRRRLTPTIICAAPPTWPLCSPICPRRSTTLSRSPCAVPSILKP